MAARRGTPQAHPVVDPRAGAAPSASDPARGQPVHPSCTISRNYAPVLPGKTEIRILFIFDPQRRAVLLVAGDKAGNWTRWYWDAIKLAEDRYARYLATPPEEIR
jgi:hypothetical protein